MANVTTNDTKFGIAMSDQKLVRGKFSMQIMPNFYSEFGLCMINNFRFLLLYYILLMACKYLIHVFIEYYLYLKGLFCILKS